MTVKQWIDFMSNEKEIRFGIKTKGGMTCPENHYFTKEKALNEFKDWLDDEVISGFPFNGKDKDGILLCLLEIA